MSSGAKSMLWFVSVSSKLYTFDKLSYLCVLKNLLPILGRAGEDGENEKNGYTSIRKLAVVCIFSS